MVIKPQSKPSVAMLLTGLCFTGLKLTGCDTQDNAIDDAPNTSTGADNGGDEHGDDTEDEHGDSSSDPKSGGEGDDDDDDDDDDDGSHDEDADDGGDSGATPAEFSVESTLSSAIATVGIVEWSVNIDVEQAVIEFGPDTNYGQSAPVDLDETHYRTVLLGMKPSTEYHFRIVVESASGTHESDDYALTTGPASNSLLKPTVETQRPTEVSHGYIVSNFASKGLAFIVDHEGDYVWWYQAPWRLSSRARLSYDGKYVWFRDNNVGHDSGSIIRVSMDGLDITEFDLPDSHHDLTVLPSGSIAHIEYDGEGCDNVVEMDNDGNSKVIIELAEVFNDADSTPEDRCHSNSLHYHPSDDTFTLSSLRENAYVKFSHEGDVLWILGGAKSDFPGATWVRQHGHQLVDNGILIFSNGDDTVPSRLLEYELEEDSLTANLVWSYEGEYETPILGDAQLLPNGNRLATYATDGVIEEVNESGEVVHVMVWPLGGGLGYSMHRPTLYGAPPR